MVKKKFESLHRMRDRRQRGQFEVGEVAVAGAREQLGDT